MDPKPLDLEEHEKDEPLSVWKRRAMFVLLIGLCVSFAAPTFGTCSGALGSGGVDAWATFSVGGEERIVRDDGTDSDHHRVDARPDLMQMIEGGRPVDMFGVTGQCCDTTIQ